MPRSAVPPGRLVPVKPTPRLPHREPGRFDLWLNGGANRDRTHAGDRSHVPCSLVVTQLPSRVIRGRADLPEILEPVGALAGRGTRTSQPEHSLTGTHRELLRRWQKVVRGAAAA